MKEIHLFTKSCTKIIAWVNSYAVVVCAIFSKFFFLNQYYSGKKKQNTAPHWRLEHWSTKLRQKSVTCSEGAYLWKYFLNWALMWTTRKLQNLTDRFLFLPWGDLMCILLSFPFGLAACCLFALPWSFSYLKSVALIGAS